MSLLIKGGHVIDPANGIDEPNDIFIDDGKILELDKKINKADKAEVIDAKGLCVIPGIVDIAARFREPGEENKATIESESRAAAASGITTVCNLPDTDPIIDTTAGVELIRQQSKRAGYCNVHVIAALTAGLNGEQLTSMAELKEAGCVGLTNVHKPIASTLVLRRSFEYASSHNLTVFFQPIDHSLSDGGCVHEGEYSTRLGLSGIPRAAETTSVAQILALAQEVGVRVHFCRLSTMQSVNMIEWARYEGVKVTADVAAHQLFLTDADITGFNTMCHTIPPLRTRDDKLRLIEGVESGVIDAVCSDHQPHNADAKYAPFPASEPGISSLETLLPLMMELSKQGAIGRIDAIRRLTSQPAEILNINAGKLDKGMSADVCIFNPDTKWRFKNKEMHSAGNNSPFNDWEFSSKIIYTIFKGKVVYNTGKKSEHFTPIQ